MWCVVDQVGVPACLHPFDKDDIMYGESEPTLFEMHHPLVTTETRARPSGEENRVSGYHRSVKEETHR